MWQQVRTPSRPALSDLSVNSSVVEPSAKHAAKPEFTPHLAGFSDKKDSYRETTKTPKKRPSKTPAPLTLSFHDRAKSNNTEDRQHAVGKQVCQGEVKQKETEMEDLAKQFGILHLHSPDIVMLDVRQCVQDLVDQVVDSVDRQGKKQLDENENWPKEMPTDLQISEYIDGIIAAAAETLLQEQASADIPTEKAVAELEICDPVESMPTDMEEPGVSPDDAGSSCTVQDRVPVGTDDSSCDLERSPPVMMMPSSEPDTAGLALMTPPTSPPQCQGTTENVTPAILKDSVDSATPAAATVEFTESGHHSRSVSPEGDACSSSAVAAQFQDSERSPRSKTLAGLDQVTSVCAVPKVEAGTCTTPVQYTEAACSPHHLGDTSTTPFLKWHLCRDQATSPMPPSTVHPEDREAFCAMTTPILQRYRERDQGTSPAFLREYRDAETATHHSDDFYQTSSTMTTPSMKRRWEIDQGTSPIAASTVDTGTSPQAPSTTASKGTMTTPLGVHYPSDGASNSSEVGQLVSDLEIAAISNELLRKEVDKLRQQESRYLSMIKQLKEKNEGQDKTVSELVQKAKDAMQGDIGDLMSQVGQHLNEIGTLESIIKEKSDDLSRLQEEKNEVEERYKKQVLHLQADLRRSYQQHKQEVSSLTQDQNRVAYVQACKQVEELQTELDVYRQKIQKLRRNRDAQNSEAAKMKTLTRNCQEFHARLKEKHIKLAEKEQSLIHQQDELDRKEKELQSAMVNCQQEMKSMERKKNLTQILYEDSLTQLYESTAQIAGLAPEIHLLKEEKERLEEEVEKQEKKNKDLEDSLQRWSAEIQVVETDMQRKDTEIQQQRARAEDAESKMKTMNEFIEIELKRFEEEMAGQVASLQGTLEEKEQTITKQNEELQEFGNLREKYGNLQDQLETLQTQHRDNQEFMEEERKMLAESLEESENKLKVDNLELSRQRVKVFEKTEECAQLTATVEQLGVQLHDVQLELSGTKAQAEWLLYKQVNEINSATTEIKSLRDELHKMTTAIQQKLNSDKKITTNISSSVEQPTAASTTQRQGKSQTGAAGASSLVSSVLEAVRKSSATTSVDAADSPDAPQPSERRLTIGESAGSAFQPLQSAANQGGGDEPGADESEAVIGEPDVTLGDQVSDVKAMLTEFWQLIKVLENAGHKSIEELSEQVYHLTRNKERLTERYDNDLDLIKDQLHESEARERRLQHELKQKRNELHESEQSLEYSKVKISEMADNLGRFTDQQSNIQKFTKQIDKLTSECQLLSREKTVLQQELEDALRRLEDLLQSKSLGSKEAVYIREKMILKQEVEKLKLHMMEKDEYYENMNAKAIKQWKTLEGNWKKAEEEVYRLDEIVELVRQTLKEVPEVVENHQELNRLLQLLSPNESEQN